MMLRDQMNAIDEYVAFSESTAAAGQYTCLVAMKSRLKSRLDDVSADGQYTYRDMVMADINRIEQTASTTASGWIFRKTSGGNSSVGDSLDGMIGLGSGWVKRFALLRGEFLFLFHNPQSDKPIAIVPLQQCQTNSIRNNTHTGAQTFYEFDIRHNSRATARFCVPSDGERVHWMKNINQNANTYNNQHGGDRYMQFFNITVTTTVLSTAPTPQSPGANITPTQDRYRNPYSVPSPYSTDSSPSLRPPLPDHPWSASPGGGGLGLGDLRNDFYSSPPIQPLTDYRHSYLHDISNPSSPTNPPPLPPSDRLHRPDESGVGAHTSINNIQSSHDEAKSGVSSEAPTSSMPNSSMQVQVPPKTSFNNFILLEKNLQKKVTDIAEARDREAAVRLKMRSRASILGAQQELGELEAMGIGPMGEEQGDGARLTLAEMFRLSLFFFDEDLAEDPQPGTIMPIPHLRGSEVELILVQVYQNYCSTYSVAGKDGDGASGFMNLEGLVEFLEDSAIHRTHVPHDEYDKPLKDFTDTLLDPVRLVTLIPRSYGNYNDNNVGRSAMLERELAKAAKKDRFIINFTQFYQLLLRITEILYPNLYETDSTFAFHKLLSEVIIPLFNWTHWTALREKERTRLEKVREMAGGVDPSDSSPPPRPPLPKVRLKGAALKRGATDPLLRDERVLLLCNLYSPNLWLTYLTYARDSVGRGPEVSPRSKDADTSYPLWAQTNEKGMFRLPPVCPEKWHYRASESNSKAGALPAKTRKIRAGSGSTQGMERLSAAIQNHKPGVRGLGTGLDPAPVLSMDSLFITEAMLLRFAADFALTPHLVTTKQLKDIFRRSNRHKTIVSSRLVPPPTPAMASTAASGASTAFSASQSAHSLRGAPRGPGMGLMGKPFQAGSRETRTAQAMRKEKEREKLREEVDDHDSMVPPPPPTHQPSANLVGGLGFSEFVEAVCRIAVEGMDNKVAPEYGVLFPSPYAKVLAMFTVWGTANLDKLDDVKETHAEGDAVM